MRGDLKPLLLFHLLSTCEVRRGFVKGGMLINIGADNLLKLSTELLLAVKI